MNTWRNKTMALAMSLAATLAAAEPPAEAGLPLHIAAQPVGDALNDLARQTGLQVVLFAEASAGVVTPPLNGVYTPSAALEKLLAATGLRFEFINSNTIAVRSRKAADDGLKKTTGNAGEAPGYALRVAQASSAGEGGAGAGSSVVEEGESADPDLQYVTVFGRTLKDTYTVREVPQTLAVFDSSFQFNAAAADVYNVLRFVPTTASRYSEIGFYPGESVIRGFQVARTINGISVDTLNHGADLVNAERVEVLMGPASVLFGSQQPGAVVNIVTKQPKDHFHLELEAGAGSYQDQRYAVDVGGPLSDRVRLRFNAAYRDRESFLDHWDLNKITLAPTLVADLTDATQLTLEGFYSRNEWGAGTWLGGPPEGLLRRSDLGYYSRSFFLANPDEDEGVGTVRAGGTADVRLTHKFSEALTGRVSFSYTHGRSDDSDIIPFGFIDMDDNGVIDGDDYHSLIRLYFVGFGSTDDNYSYYADLAGEMTTGPVRHRFVVGAEYRSLHFDAGKGRGAGFADIIDPFAPVYGFTRPAPFLLNATVSRDQTRGIFVQDRMSIGERFHLIAGIRYAEIDSSATFTPRGGAPLEPDVISQSAVPKQFGVLYDVSERISVFANRSESFLPRGGTTAGGKAFNPEKGEQTEVGTKFDLGDSGVAANIALFQVEKPEVLTPDPDNFGFDVPLGAVESRGVEVSVNGRLRPNWTLYAAYAHMKTDVDGNDPALDGNELANAPQNTFSAMTRYDIAGGALDGLGFSAALQYSDSRFADDGNIVSLPGYTRLDLGAYYAFNDHVDVSLLINNATDEDIFAGFSENWVSLDMPRTFLARVKYKL
jgi:iron complex outermembrane receptor protein